MNTYLIPREIGDENKFLFFSTRSLIFTAIFAVPGIILHMFVFGPLAASMESLELKITGVAIAFLIAGIGYCLGTFKIPELKIAAFFKNASGEYLNDIIKRVFKFRKRRKIYIYERGNI